MSDATHTPGPWSVRPLKHDDWGMVRGADGYPVALCATGARGVDEFRERARYGTPEYEAGPPEVLANANLIAAAPEMLHVLKRVALHAQGAGGYIGRNGQLLKDVLDAIAKAEGE